MEICREIEWGRKMEIGRKREMEMPVFSIEVPVVS
jgi:hypothetical protein